jgi:peptidoglycan/LPS O-acetylase OafA/YrhL
MSPAGNTRHIPALDGLRGLAILFVLLWHYFAFTQPYFPGWAGVDLFFTLSGYLITSRLLATRQQPDYFSRFYRNRILRIFPLYYTLVIAFLLVARWGISAPNQPLFSYYLDHWKSFLVFTQNWTFITNGRPANLTLVPLWSIAVEEQFYLVWPLIILLTPSPAARQKLFIAGIILVLGLRTAFYLANPPSGESAYYNTFFRLDGLLAGSLLCQWHASGKTIRKPAAAIFILLFLCILACTWIGDVLPYNAFFATSGYTILALLFTAMTNLATQPGNNPLTRFLNNSFLRFCGRISYCLYLIHVPVLQFVGTKLSILGAQRWPEQATTIHWLAILLSLALSFLLSALSYRYFESIFLKLKVNKGLAPKHAEQ